MTTPRDDDRSEPSVTPERHGMSRRSALAGLGAAAALAAGRVLSPAPLFASTPAWRADLVPPAPQGQARMLGVPFEKHATVRLAVIGTGLRGRSVLREFLAVEGVQVTALADIVPDKAARGAKLVTDAGQPAPALYTNGERDFERLLARTDIDFVYIATPWDWHTPMAVAAMRAGKHVGVEVPAAFTLEDCWQLVATSEATRKHCLMMENVCYGYNELLVLNMVRAGAFGELKHAEAAYIHDLRKILFEDRDEGLWRRTPHLSRDGNLYPTHGLGPVAQYLGIHRGDRFDYMVSMSSPELSLTAYRDATYPAGSPKHAEQYRCGDMNTSLIKTVQGRTIMLQHDVVSPRPYDRLNMISGTKGAFCDYPARLYLEGMPGGEKWNPIDSVKAQYEHPLWTNVGELARKLGGHGGMDFIMCYRTIQCLREGLAPDFDVYDAAAWSAPGPLSEASVASGSQPARFPDFTRGSWAGTTSTG
jgi:predicted dehydrogenase